jgi:penicillin-binding protein 1A
MASAYLTFATRGERVEPNVIVRVTDADGNVLWEPRPQRTRVMEPAEADVVNHVLQQVVQRGTGTRARLDTPAAGKTGTTQSYGDAWFVGYTPGLSTAVWVGYPDGQDHDLRGVHGIDVTGGTLPAEIWKRFMDVATDDRRYRGEFVEPDDLGGALVPDSGRVRVVEETTTTVEDTTTTSSSLPEDESTTTTDPGGGSTTTSSAPDGEESTTTTTGPETTTTTASTVVPAGPG